MRTRSGLDGLLQRSRVWKYRILSDCERLTGSPTLRQPVLFLGPGTIEIGADVEFGWQRSVAFYSGYCHVEAASPDAAIEFGDATQVNNNAFIKSEGAGIRIGARALIGSCVRIFDSDFHDLDPLRRRGGEAKMAAVELQDNVFIGDNAMILKGVTVGRDSVIGAGSVVVRSIPPGVIAAGNPARVVRDLSASGVGPTSVDRLDPRCYPETLQFGAVNRTENRS